MMTEGFEFSVSTVFTGALIVLALVVGGRALWWLNGFIREMMAVSQRRLERGETYRRQLARYFPIFSFGLEDCASIDAEEQSAQPTHVAHIKTKPVFPEAWSVPQRPEREVSHRNGFRIGRRAHRRDPKPRVAAAGR